MDGYVVNKVEEAVTCYDYVFNYNDLCDMEDVRVGLKATWSIMKFVCMVILLPVFLVGLVFMGLIYLAIPILIIVGIVAIIGRFTTA